MICVRLLLKILLMPSLTNKRLITNGLTDQGLMNHCAFVWLTDPGISR